MGLLSEGEPLSWEETKKYSRHIRRHGILQFINQYHRLKDRSKDCLMWGDEVITFAVRWLVKIGLCQHPVDGNLLFFEYDHGKKTGFCCRGVLVEMLTSTYHYQHVLLTHSHSVINVKLLTIKWRHQGSCQSASRCIACDSRCVDGEQAEHSKCAAAGSTPQQS